MIIVVEAWVHVKNRINENESWTRTNILFDTVALEYAKQLASSVMLMRCYGVQCTRAS